MARKQKPADPAVPTATVSIVAHDDHAIATLSLPDGRTREIRGINVAHAKDIASRLAEIMMPGVAVAIVED